MTLDDRVSWDALREWLAGTRLVRSVADAVLHGAARRHVADLDQTVPARAQARALLDLVRRARRTRFGRDHDFDRIRSVGDFRRLVPLRRPADLWQSYWDPAWPHLDGITWPGPIRHAAGVAPGARPPEPPGGRNGSAAQAGVLVPVSAELLAAHRRAVWTALSFIRGVRPRARLLTGRILAVGRRALTRLDDEAAACSLEEAALLDLAPRKRPYVLTAATAEAGLLDEPVTCVIGEAGELLRFFARLLDLARRDCVREVWPGLAAVLYHGDEGGQGRTRLAEAVASGAGPAPVLLEALVRPEGTVAVEDPRHGLLRFLPAHDLYAEFIPAAEADGVTPTRLDIEEVEPHVAYEVALTSPAGLWACRMGLTVAFENRDPPLLRVLATATAGGSQPAARTDTAVLPFPTQPPHPRSAGSPAAPPGRSAHTPWSARADRG